MYFENPTLRFKMSADINKGAQQLFIHRRPIAKNFELVADPNRLRKI